MTPSDTLGQLIAVFTEWQGFLKDPQYVRIGRDITWQGVVSAITPQEITKREVHDLAQRGQYTFRVSDDDSLIQLFYRFARDGELEAARLAYYELGVNAFEEEIEVIPWDEIEESSAPATWVRFDYVHTGRSRVLHMDSHLHISGLPGIRFAVTGVPTPKQFVEFVASHFYPDRYKEHRLAGKEEFESFAAIDNINMVSVTPRIPSTDVYRRIPHFRIPGN